MSKNPLDELIEWLEAERARTERALRNVLTSHRVSDVLRTEIDVHDATLGKARELRDKAGTE